MSPTTVHFLINLPSQHKFLRGFNGENQRGTELSDSGTDCRGQLDYGSLSNLHQEHIPKIQGIGTAIFEQILIPWDAYSIGNN